MTDPASRSPGTIGSRRHHLAILFSDLCSSTAIASKAEPEHYAALLQSLRDILAEMVARHGGEIARIDGDGALCIFGYPGNHEDAGRRATEAAIDIHAAVDALPRDPFGEVSLHSGIHAGLVLLREGDMVRGRFEMLGDATNVAARLSEAAGAGEIIVSESTLGADRHFFRTGPTRYLEIAGHNTEIAVVAVESRQASATRFAARTRRGLTPFAGRAAELEQLHAWLARPTAGDHDRLALIAGPPGIGKTRLLGEFSAEADQGGVAVHRGCCESYLGARPLQPFVHLAHSMIDAATGAIPASVIAAVRDGLTIAGEPGRIAEIMRALIDRAVRDGPCLLVIDDWQWADGASRKLLDTLIPATDARARFLLASRENVARFETTAPGEVIIIPPLPDRAAEVAAGALLPQSDPFLAARICEEAGGNPLFLEELCHAARRRRASGGGIAPSAWLDMLIQARYAQLRPDQAALVRMAAIIGDSMPAWLFTAVTGARADDPAVTGLADADFLYPGDIAGTLRFKHRIARDAVYRTIGLDDRQALHLRVVEALHAAARLGGGPPNLDALAYHYAAGGDLDAAIPYAIKAGDAALAAGAVDRAQAHYRAAFEALAANPGNDESAILIWKLVNKYGLACITDPSPEQMPVLGKMVVRMAALGQSAALVRSKYWIGAIAYGLGDGRRSAADLTAALQLARAHGQNRLIPQIELKLAQSLLAAGDYARADAMFDRVLPVIRAGVGRNDTDALAYGLCCHGFLLADQGNFTAADQRYGEAEILFDGAAPPLLASCITQLSAVHLMRGQWAEALAQAQRCAAVCGTAHTHYQAMMANALGALARWRMDRDPDATDALLGVARWFASDASRQRTSLVYGWLAEIMEQTGQADQARHYAARSILRVRDGGDRLGEAMAYHAMARLAARGDDRHRAAHYLGRAYRSAAIRRSPRERALTDCCAAQLALYDSDDAGAAVLIECAAAAFDAMGAPVLATQARALSTTSH